MPCTTCDIKVEYTCSASDTNAISFTLRLINNVGTAVPYSNITIRYWFTKNATTPKLECYYTSVAGMCASVLGTFHPMAAPVANADTYLEVGFASAAGTLDGFHNNTQDQIQLAVHDATYASPTIQTDDYSFDCSMLKMEIESPLITAYIGGQLKFGTEPGGSTPVVDAGSGN
jgi:hypothetical protein